MDRLKELLASIARYRVGFHIHEVMSGSHAFEPGYGPRDRQPFEFSVTWGPRDLLQWIDPRHASFMTQQLRGRVTVGGLCSDAPCDGTLALRYFDEHAIRYDFAFEVDDRRYRYVGEKVNIRPWNLPVSHTTCYGVITEADTGRLVSRSVAHFRMKTMPSFAASLRFDLALPEPVEATA